MQRPRNQQKQVRSLIWREGPEGMYPFEMFFMEGKDLAGFNGVFSFAFIKEETQFHPIEGMVVHPYDEVLLFGSLNRDDMLDLGADVSIEIGEEREEYTFNQTYAVAIPKGVPHGPVKVKNVRRPFVYFTISMDPVYSGEIIPPSELKAPVEGSCKYKNCAVLFAGDIDPETGLLRGGVSKVFNQTDKPVNIENIEDKTGMGYNRLVDTRGVIHSRNRGGMGPGNSDNLVWIFGDDLLDFDVNVLWGHYSHEGIWHRMGECHSHTEEEILVLVGNDPDDPLNLGACVEIAMGEEDERYAVTVPTAFCMPKNYLHLPSITRWVEKPYGFIGINLAKTHDSPWEDRDGTRRIVAHTI